MKTKQSNILDNIITKGLRKSSGNAALHPIDAIFIALLEEETSHATHILRHTLKDWELYQLRVRIEREGEKIAQTGKYDNTNILNTLAASLEELSVKHQGSGSEPVINSGHMLLHTITDYSTISARILALYHITTESIAEQLRELPAEEDYYSDMNALSTIKRFNTQVDSGSSASHAPLASASHAPPSRSNDKLLEYGTDLTLAAQSGHIDPVIGREKEIERLIQILGRRKKNNPILIGEAGVGKSAIVEGLALRIASREVPSSLLNKRIISLDITALVAGTKYRGEFEERMKELLEHMQGEENLIIFIDEIHTIVGAGSTQGSLDTANILKPALARGTMQCIGATTLDEFRENIESDAALERRFQKIIVEPTSKQETLQILNNIKPHYEKHHSVLYSDEALKSCVELTERYITDRHFPDKAIDVMDEAGSRANILANGLPKELCDMELQLRRSGEKKRNAVASLQYEEAAMARLQELALENRYKELVAEVEKSHTQNPYMVSENDIQHVISKMTGIPTEGLSQSEKSRLQNLANHLGSVVIGQDSAVEKISLSIQRSRAGLKDPNKPIGVFMFVGPSGVGKTLLAKELAKHMFTRNDALVRIDMSEYSEKHNISRLIGSPPGYVGYNEGGQLTETVRRQPYSIILFDEIEKAHPDTFNVMLQIFDEGHLTDGLGRKVDFRNTIIIMTSNVGSREVVEKRSAVGYTTIHTPQREVERNDGSYRKAMESTFAPEFINRIDDIIIFNTLTHEDVERIVELELKMFNKRTSLLGYHVHITPSAKQRLAALGLEPRYGVRSLKRVIMKHIEEPLAQMIVNEEITASERIDVTLRSGEITLIPKITKRAM